ncbi:MAG TPA: hypothetical protein PLJ35_12435 [Anaerolineae bacterium]|nr:hypothetical protein [Anaerolineae bacterium]HPL30880.1 hypothetical protein [Anaerolineae bacterium]
MNESVTSPPLEASGCLLLTSSVIHLDAGHAVVLLAAQPDPARPGQYRLEATVVPAQPLPAGLRLVASWAGGQRTARLDTSGCARLRGVPATALAAGGKGTLLVSIEKVMGESNALG